MSVWIQTGEDAGLREEGAASISVFDHGLTVGDGVFETLKVLAGEPLALTRHLRRLLRSCEVLGLSAPKIPEIRAAVAEVIASNPDAAHLGRLRITHTGGSGPLASDRDAGAHTTIVALVGMNPWPATTSAIVVPWARNERSAVTGAKTTSYAENVVALSWAHQRGFSEGLFCNSVGELCEGTGTNVFVIQGDQALTPPLSSGCLAGITRELLLEWNLAQEQTLTEDDLHSADEVFVTSSTRDVHPVARLGGRSWDGPGEVTRHIAAQYVRSLAQNIDP
jgi:branched-chain amino acid aminotransferase